MGAVEGAGLEPAEGDIPGDDAGGGVLRRKPHELRQDLPASPPNRSTFAARGRGSTYSSALTPKMKRNAAPMTKAASGHRLKGELALT